MENCVLIYDDDESILFLCKAILAQDNYRVEVRSNCKNVIDDINLVKPDVILMDLWIPEIGGELTIPIIKANADTKHIPVVIFSANSQLKEICKKIKADGYLEKPFDISLLKETVDKFIRKI